MITYVAELKSDNFSETIKGNKIVLVDVMTEFETEGNNAEPFVITSFFAVSGCDTGWSFTWIS